MAKNCVNIKYLGIKGCWRIKNDAIRVMREYCKDLKELRVRDCAKITEASLALLRARGVMIDVEKPAYYQRHPVAFDFTRGLAVNPALYVQI